MRQLPVQPKHLDHGQTKHERRQHLNPIPETLDAVVFRQLVAEPARRPSNTAAADNQDAGPEFGSVRFAPSQFRSGQRDRHQREEVGDGQDRAVQDTSRQRTELLQGISGR